uniref:Mating-type protein MAT1-2-1 n=1 Tax=Thielaviopsis paradoxa TaxID=13001 RepID=A0A2K8HDG6_9PEZI|nr:mating-type protein MAT1-2-1 [Thielaviopsis paradoxa]
MDSTSPELSSLGAELLDINIMDAIELDPTEYFNAQQQQILESAWSIATVQVSQFSRVAALHSSVVLALNQESLAALLQAFSILIEDTAIIARDSVNFSRFFIGSIQNFNETNSSVISIDGCDTPVLVQSSSQSTDTNHANPTSSNIQPAVGRPASSKPKIPRPPNAYILYRKERHQDLKKSRPGIDNNEISRILGRRWREEPESVRMHYKKQAEDYKTQFMKTFPDYQYRPRKAAEKKQRVRSSNNSISAIPPSAASDVGLQPVSISGCASPDSSFSEDSTGTP